MQITGSCHCGNVKFMLAWQPEPGEIPARACGCTFCRKHGGVWTSCPTGALCVHVRNPERVNRYNFGTRTADFHICMNCGVVPLVTSDIAGTTYAVVNVNAFENVDASLLMRTDSNFEGEDEQTRLARRTRGWIPRVRFVAEGAG